MALFRDCVTELFCDHRSLHRNVGWNSDVALTSRVPQTTEHQPEFCVLYDILRRIRPPGDRELKKWQNLSISFNSSMEGTRSEAKIASRATLVLPFKCENIQTCPHCRLGCQEMVLTYSDPYFGVKRHAQAISHKVCCLSEYRWGWCDFHCHLHQKINGKAERGAFGRNYLLGVNLS